MLNFKVIVLVCAIFGAVYGTLGSDLEEDDFRSLKDTDSDSDSENELLNDLNEGEDVQNDLEDDTKSIYNPGEIWFKFRNSWKLWKQLNFKKLQKNLKKLE